MNKVEFEVLCEASSELNRIVVVDVCWLKILSLNIIFSTFHVLWNEVNLETMNINRYLQLKESRTAKIMILPLLVKSN